MSVPVNRGDPHLIQRRRSAKLGTVAEPAQIQFLSGLDMPSQADDPIAPDLLLVKLSQRFRLGEARQISLWTVSNAFGISTSSSFEQIQQQPCLLGGQQISQRAPQPRAPPARPG